MTQGKYKLFQNLGLVVHFENNHHHNSYSGRYYWLNEYLLSGKLRNKNCKEYISQFCVLIIKYLKETTLEIKQSLFAGSFIYLFRIMFWRFNSTLRGIISGSHFWVSKALLTCQGGTTHSKVWLHSQTKIKQTYSGDKFTVTSGPLSRPHLSKDLIWVAYGRFIFSC